jgi:hypothetical protein
VRAMMFIMLVIIAFVIAISVCEPFRLKVEKVLFGEKAEAPVVAEPTEPPAAASPTPAAAGPKEPAGTGTKEPAAAATAPEAAPKESEDTGEGKGGLRSLLEELKPDTAKGGGPVKPTLPGAPVDLPPDLRKVQFGTPAEEVKRNYAIAWTKEELGEVMLTHYPTPDRSASVRFYLSGDSLYRIEVRLTPPKGQTREQLYNSFKAQYAQYYADVARKSDTKWSDGSVTAEIKLQKDQVELIFVCPKAKR